MLKKHALQLCTASATTDENAAKVVKFTKDLQACIAGLGDAFDDAETKTKVGEINKQLQTLLASFEDDKKQDNHAEKVIGLAESAHSILSEAIKAKDTQIQTLRASIPTEIASAIEAKVKGGEYFSKADYDKAVSDATSAATTAARDAAIAEIKVISGRRAQLATASIPVPADELLAGDDAAFTAKQDTAKKRVEDLKSFKLPEDRVISLAWNTDEAAYQNSLELMKKAFEAAGRPAGANGFKNSGDGTQNAAKPKITLC